MLLDGESTDVSENLMTEVPTALKRTVQILVITSNEQKMVFSSKNKDFIIPAVTNAIKLKIGQTAHQEGEIQAESLEIEDHQEQGELFEASEKSIQKPETQKMQLNKN